MDERGQNKKRTHVPTKWAGLEGGYFSTCVAHDLHTAKYTACDHHYRCLHRTQVRGRIARYKENVSQG